jgi:GNAT superfamily N-acetyltransferase
MQKPYEVQPHHHLPGPRSVGGPRTALTFRSYRDTDGGQVVNLLGTGRPVGYAALKSAIFDWQFQQNPHSDGASPFLIGTVDDGRDHGRIVALNGVMPARILFHGQPMLACWSCDTYVSPSHRGQGFGKELVRRVSDAAPIMLGYGISDMSDPIFHQQDWLLHQDIVLLFYHVAETGLAGRFKNLGSKLIRKVTGASRPRSTELTCEDHKQFSAEADELWSASKSGYVSTVERDAAYLNWRYHQHPLHRYICYSAYCHGRLQGLLIARHDPAESVIVDYVGPAADSHLMYDLAACAVEDLAHRQTTRIRCETTHPAMIDALNRAGFLASRHASRFRVRSNISIADVLDGWFLMTGDSDNDMMPVIDAMDRAPATSPP